MSDLDPANDSERSKEGAVRRTATGSSVAADGRAMMDPSRDDERSPSTPGGAAYDGSRRGWFQHGTRNNAEQLIDPMAARLLALRHAPTEDDEPEPPPSLEPKQPPPSPDAELIFTAGPRSGDRLSLEGRSVAFDRDANETLDGSKSTVIASIWAQGEHFMVRHGGAILIDGGRPAMPIVVLEDDDELAWGPHRLQFRSGRTTGRSA